MNLRAEVMIGKEAVAEPAETGEVPASAAEARTVAAAPASSSPPPPATLAEARPDEPLCVRAVAGRPGFVRRMMDLGLRAGVPLRVVQKTPAGVVVRMDGMRMAVSPAAARHVLVSPCARARRRYA